MPGVDYIESLANVVRIEGEFTSINEQLTKTRDLVTQINQQKINAKNLSFKEVQQAQDAYNKSIVETEKREQALIKTQLEQEKLNQQRIKTMQLEEKQRLALVKASEQQKVAAENIPLEIKGTTDNFASQPDGTAVTAEDKKQVDDLTEAELEYAKARREAAVADEEGAKVAADSAGAYELQLTPLQETIKARDQLQGKIKALEADQKEDAQLLKDGVIDRVEYNKRVIESKAAIEDTKGKLKDLNAEVKAQATIANTATGSLKNNKAQLELLTIQYSKLSKEQQLSPVGLKMQKDAKAFATAIDAQQSAIGNYTKNVGNYFSKAYSGLRILANILPGVGIAGIIGAIGTAFLFLLEKLELFESTSKNTKRLIQDLGDTSQETKKALQEMGDDAIEISKKLGEEAAKNIDKYNEALGRTPSFAEKTEAAQKLLFNQVSDPSAWNKLKSFVLGGFNSFGAYIHRLNEATEAFKELKKASDEVEFTQNQAEQLEFVKQAEKVRQQGIKDEISANKDRISDTRNSFALRRALSEENLKKEVDILERQRDFELQEIKRTSKSEQEEYTRRYTAEKKFLSDKLNATREANKAIEALTREETERNRKAQSDINQQIYNDEIKRNEKVGANETELAEIRIDALQRVAKYSSDLFDQQEKDELSKTYLTDTQKEEIHAKYDALRIDKAKETADAIFKIYLNSDLLEKSAEDKLRENLQEADRVSKLGKGEGAPILHAETTDLDIALDKFHRMQDALGELERSGDKLGIAITKIFKIGAFQSTEDYLKEIQKLKDAFKQLGNEITGAIFDIFTNKIINQKNAIQDNIDALDAKRAKDIEVAQGSIANEEQRAARIQEINASADAQQTLLKKKQRDLDIRKAQFDKVQAIAGIIFNTAQGVTAALTSKPPNVILAAVVGAIGLIQAARAAAAPIPRYKTGKKRHPGGEAVLGDGGKQEGIILPDGTILASGSTPELWDLPPGTEIKPDFKEMLAEFSTQQRMHINRQGKLIDPVPAIKHMENAVVRAIKSGQGRQIQEPRYLRMLEKGHPFQIQLDKKL